MSRPGNIASMCVRKLESMAIMSSKWPWIGQSLTIQICPSRSMIVALISPTFSLIRTLTSFLPLRISSRASITQFGQSESVVRGQPRVGLLFCQDFSRGLSDHFGVKEGLGLYLFTDWIALKIPPAISVNPFSACLIGRIVSLSSLLECDNRSRWQTTALPNGPPVRNDCAATSGAVKFNYL